jgi:hypothetical protein
MSPRGNEKCNKQIKQYTTYIKVGKEGRGTAILIKDCYQLTNIQNIPTGRGISGQFNGITINNIHPPAGTEKKR